jgi:hypothetical protein
VSLTPRTQLPYTEDSKPEPTPLYRWYHKAGAVLFAIFCFELGVFLLVFPWLDLWRQNFFATYNHTIQQIWSNPYFRGTISGLGMVNIFVSFIEIVRLRRFSSS